MSEWKRHRGSSAMPKCLEGKKFDVRYRNGAVFRGSERMEWNHIGGDSDVMAFKILPSEPAAEHAKPDYSKGFPWGATAKDIGAKVGDEFVMIYGRHSAAKRGEKVVLSRDDGSENPFFTNQIGDENSIHWTFLTTIPQKTAIELQAEEVGIPEPVQYVNEGDKSPERVEKQQEIEHMPTTATQFLQSAMSTLAQRGQDYDKPEGERSAAAVAVAFNAITGKHITDAEVYLVLQLVKDVRQWQCADFHTDSALDCVAYAALKAEALASK